MVFARITAVVFLLLLVGSLSLGCIGVLALYADGHADGGHVEHMRGEIVMIETNMDFVLETTDGQRIFFSCSRLCRASLGHMQRHLSEQAVTDVYYMHGSGKSLIALDVD